jgi:hypothetical protein
VAVILGILGIVRVNRGQADNRGHAVAGLVTGALALVIGLFFAVGIGAFFATNVNHFRQFGRCMDNAGSDQARQTCAERLARDLERLRGGQPVAGSRLGALSGESGHATSPAWDPLPRVAVN